MALLRSDRLLKIKTTTLDKMVTIKANRVEYIAQTEEGTTIHLDSGKHVTTALSYKSVESLIWPKS